MNLNGQLSLPFAVALKGRNTANNGDIELIRTGTANTVVIGDSGATAVNLNANTNITGTLGVTGNLVSASVFLNSNLPLIQATQYGASSWAQTGLSSYTGANVNDGNLSSAAFHTDTAAVGSYLRLDAGSNTSFTGVAIYSGTRGGSVSQSVWEIQWSDNDSSWTSTGKYIDLRDNRGAWITQDWHLTQGGHRYWRLYKTNDATSGDYVFEVQFFVGQGSSLRNFNVDVNGIASATALRTGANTVSATSGVAYTIVTCTGVAARYEVNACLNSVNPSQYASVATVIFDGSAARLIANNGSILTISLSGTNIQVTQASGATQTIYYNWTRFGA